MAVHFQRVSGKRISVLDLMRTFMSLLELHFLGISVFHECFVCIFVYYECAMSSVRPSIHPPLPAELLDEWRARAEALAAERDRCAADAETAKTEADRVKGEWQRVVCEPCPMCVSVWVLLDV